MLEKESCCGHHSHPAPHGHAHGHAHKHEHRHEHGYVASPTSAKTTAIAGTRQLALNIVNMDCPTEEALIRQCLTPLPGVAALDFDLLNRILTVHHTLQDTSGIQAKLVSIGMQGRPVSAANDASQAGGQASAMRKKWLVMGFAGIMAVAAETCAYLTGNDTSLPVALLALTAILAGGVPTLKKAWIALRHFTLNIHLLMAVAVIGAAAIGQWPEAAVVIWLFGIAEMIEAASLDRARNAISGLMAHAPETAWLQQTDGSWQETATTQIELGQLLRIRPGDRIALDGTVETGQSAVDQAAITGESMPVAKTVGDKVYAGTLNQAGMLEIRVTSLQNETTLARIARSVQQAQSQRAPTQRFVDKFAGIYTPLVFVIALLVAVLPPLHLSRAGLAGDRLPLRPGHLHTGNGGLRAGAGGKTRHPGEGRAISGARPAIDEHRAGQDRHADRRQACIDRHCYPCRHAGRPRTAHCRQPGRAVATSGGPCNRGRPR